MLLVNFVKSPFNGSDRNANNKILIEKMKRVNQIISKLNMSEIVSDIMEDRRR